MTLGTATLTSAWSALGSTVVHFIWQGLLIGLVMAAVFACMRQRSSSARYAVASGAMLLSLVSFVATFFMVLSAPAGEGVLPLALAERVPEAELLTGLALPRIAAWCWALGALCMAVRLAVQGYGANRLKVVAVSEPDAFWRRAFQSIQDELGVARSVRLLRSGLAEVPTVVGWLSPVVLVPVSAFTTLSSDQLRALLAHELAHIRRHDHLFNAAQAVVETVLFFHPVIWWISKQMRIEREYCCDDSSVRLTGDPRLLAEALTAMETLRISPTPPATPTHAVLASNGGSLVQRIQRILGVRLDSRRSSYNWHLPLGIVLTGLLAAGTVYAAPVLERSDTGGEERREQRRDDPRAEYAAIEARMLAAVRAGEMTREEAGRKLDEVRRRMFGERDEQRGERRRLTREDYARAEAEMKKMVAEGKAKPEDVERRLAAMRKMIADDGREAAAKAAKVAEYREIEARIRAALEAGDVSPQEAERKLLAARQRMFPERTKLELMMHKVEAAVKAGELTPEEARKKIGALRRKQEASTTSVERFVDSGTEATRGVKRTEAVIERIEAGVKAGKLTPEQGKARLEAYKKGLAERKAAADDRNLEAVAREIEAGVKAGKLTPEQGKARLEAYKKRRAERKAVEVDVPPEVVIERIEAAVKAGKLTPAQGREKIEAYKMRLAEQKAAQEERTQER